MNTHHHHSPPSASPSLQFGIEIELLLGGRKKGTGFASWTALASDLSKRLSSAGIANRVHDDAKALDQYHEWAIVREVTVPNQPAKELCEFWVSFLLPLVVPPSASLAQALLLIPYALFYDKTSN